MNPPVLSDHNLSVLWHTLVFPCLPLLADECGLSVIAVQHATPLCLTAIYYQLVKLAHIPNALETVVSLPTFKDDLVNKGVNFKQLAMLRPHIDSLSSAFFTDTRSYWVVIGIVSDRTQAYPPSLARLIDWLIFFVLKTTKQVMQNTGISANDFGRWLPFSLPATQQIDNSLLSSIILDKSVSVRDLFYPTGTGLPSDVLTTYTKLWQVYPHSQKMTIVPKSSPVSNFSLPQTPTTVPNLLAGSKLGISKSTHSANDIFTSSASSSESWQNQLQKHWIAFTLGLSALVIGGIGAIFTSHTPAITSPKPNPTLSAEIPHDVAIVRTQSATSSTPLPSHLKAVPPPKTSTSINETSSAKKDKKSHQTTPANNHKHTVQSPTTKVTPNKANDKKLTLENTANPTTHSKKEPIKKSPKQSSKADTD